MSDPTLPDSLDALISQSMNGLRAATDAHNATWHLEDADQWKVDQDRGEIIFEFKDGTIASAPVQMIGTLNSKNEWLWAWSNSSIDDKLKVDAQRVREYGEVKGDEWLTEPRWAADAMDAWAMTAIAFRICNANGAYRAPIGTTFLYMTFGEVKLTKGQQS